MMALGSVETVVMTELSMIFQCSRRPENSTYGPMLV